jgi:hypothetical protein
MIVSVLIPGITSAGTLFVATLIRCFWRRDRAISAR